MRQWQEWHREGTDVGPVDWSHSFVAQAVARGIPEATLRAMAESPSEYLVTSYGDHQHRVIAVCMYDGWPYWQPGPACLVEGTLGAEWVWFNSLSSVQRHVRTEARRG